ncbi:transporter substrate-binding domain-containing protein [Orrella sp. 11846]|uniref:transporter substrate-binding domain-containing protein n=1 Tax=Orrella sp. 11846 TaxID=3409913 RepID=UPI003B5A73F8
MDQNIVKAFAPTGVLRASINTGNAVLAKALGQGQAGGVSVNIAEQLAKALGVDLELVVFDKAALSVQAVEEQRADIGFFAIDPKRADQISFTHPYVLIEGAYVVRQESDIQDNDQVDATNHRIVVGQGSAYDLYLTRNIKHATLERTPSSQMVVQTFLDTEAQVAAGVRQQLEFDLRERPFLRMLPGRFMVIRQAMGIHKSRGPEAAAFLREFVERVKAQGLVQQFLDDHGIEGAGVAGPSDPADSPI